MTKRKPGKADAGPEREAEEIGRAEALDDADLDEAAGGLGLSRSVNFNTVTVNAGEADTPITGAADFNTADLNFNTAGLAGLDKLKR